MAEDDVNANDLDTSDYNQSSPPTAPARNTPRSRKNQKNHSRSYQRARSQSPNNQKPKCRPRIDRLAIPSRRLILALYQNHANTLPKDKVEKVKTLLQELYAMTPEETVKYLEHLRNKAEERSRQKYVKYLLKRLLKNKNKSKAQSKAYEFINNLLVKSIEFAVQNPVPPLVSVRLRNLSNIILEQICYLRNINVPNRDHPDEIGSLLIEVADWIAIAIELLYYKVQLKKNKELEKIELEAKRREKEKKKEEKKETKEIIKPKSTDSVTEKVDEEAVLTDELLVSDIE